MLKRTIKIHNKRGGRGGNNTETERKGKKKFKSERKTYRKRERKAVVGFISRENKERKNVLENAD